MYLFANKSIKMNSGKLAVQISHAAVKSYINSKNDIRDFWDRGSYVKILLSAKNSTELIKIKHSLEKIGLSSGLIIDEGRTEIKPNTITALGVEIVDKKRYEDFFKKYQLYR